MALPEMETKTEIASDFITEVTVGPVLGSPICHQLCLMVEWILCPPHTKYSQGALVSFPGVATGTFACGQILVGVHRQRGPDKKLVIDDCGFLIIPLNEDRIEGKAVFLAMSAIDSVIQGVGLEKGRFASALTIASREAKWPPLFRCPTASLPKSPPKVKVEPIEDDGEVTFTPKRLRKRPPVDPPAPPPSPSPQEIKKLIKSVETIEAKVPSIQQMKKVTTALESANTKECMVELTRGMEQKLRSLDLELKNYMATLMKDFKLEISLLLAKGQQPILAPPQQPPPSSTPDLTQIVELLNQMVKK